MIMRIVLKTLPTMGTTVQLLATLCLVAIAVSGDACPKYGWDFAENTIKDIPNVVSWSQCSQYCRLTLNCFAWTYYTTEASSTAQQKYCSLKNSNYMEHYRKAEGLISGVTECGDICPLDDVTFEGNTIKTITEVKTWKECSNQCRAQSSCHAWTWFSDDVTTQKPFQCHLKNSYFVTGWKQVPKSVSGDRKCGSEEANQIDGGGWLLVRHVPAGGHWYKATDQLVGTDVYGNSCGETCAKEWSVRFSNINFNQFLFAAGDESNWLIASRNEVTGSWYNNQSKRILKSSSSNAPYHVRWYRRSNHKEDPWISLNNHGEAVIEGTLLYGGNHFGLQHDQNVLPSLKHNGANVFVRFKDVPRVCERRTMRMDCPADHVIHVRSARYGRTENGVCWHGRDLDCGDVTKSTKIVKQKCEGRTSCAFKASNEVFGDPCTGTFKYLEVDYTCLTTQNALQMGVSIDPCVWCSQEAVCYRAGGDAKCICKCGFTGDGKDCTPVTFNDLYSSETKMMVMEGSCGLQRGAKLGAIPRLSAGYSVKFDVFPTVFQHGWSSILHMTIGENYGRYGDRTPGIWFHGQNPNSNTNRLHICSAVDGNQNYCYNTKVIVEKGKWSTIEVSQIRDAGEVFYTYQVKVNGSAIGTVMNEAATAFDNVKVYVSDPWHNTQPGFIRNLIIVPNADAAKPAGSMKDITSITRAMAGTWELSYTNKHQAEFIIQKDGHMKVTWNQTNTHESQLMQSLDEKSFPTSEGWVMAINIYRPGTWEYYQLREYDGIKFLQVEHFCMKHCRAKRGSLDKYCCYGVGTRDIQATAGYQESPKPAPIPNAVHWYDQGEVCFGAKGDAYGNFSITHTGKFKGIELVHVKGWISCQVINPAAGKLPTKWGCNHDMRRSLGTVVTNEHNSVIFPRTQDSGMYSYKGADAFSEKLAFSNWMNPLRVVEGQEFRIWFNEDLTKHSDRDNMGMSCAFVRAYIEH